MNFETLGYESSLFLLNMGSLIFYKVLFLIALLILMPMMFCRHIVRKRVKRILDRIFFNSILKFFEETYLITTLCCFINISHAIDTQKYFELNSVLAYLALIEVVIYPSIILYIWLKYDTEKLKSHKFRSRVGVIYEDLNLRYGKATLIWPFFINLEKLILAYVLVFV